MLFQFQPTSNVRLLPSTNSSNSARISNLKILIKVTARKSTFKPMKQAGNLMYKGENHLEEGPSKGLGHNLDDKGHFNEGRKGA